MGTIEIDGFEELEQALQEMTITEADEKRAMKKALEPIYEEVMRNAPESKGNLKRQIKTSVKREDFSTVGKVRLGVWYSKFNEFGTSQSKKNVGFFERSVNSTKDQAIKILTEELLK
ncbi:HK97-gp10 family putative phage morphogenesis protein [Desulfitobacterium sp. PCE1]|uniref:HK97-gp10 family putative phage morphogenesis protein n=1 Tax=Desulfitobacterium sp. PCE1 TaxID=146907 RepID=UPI000375062D|nr:HK97-gp10 family putative phage morphogenesis protein [Desulfitobacterium sp. PCE1]